MSAAISKSRLEVCVVSPEGEIFSGKAKAVFIKAANGDLGIYPGHSQLLAAIAPGAIRLELEDEEELLYISGGVIEIQPERVSVLADTVERPQDVNESAALEAKQKAEKLLASHKGDEPKSRQELLEAMAKLRVLELMRSRKRH